MIPLSGIYQPEGIVLFQIVKEFKADLQEAQTRKQSHTADQIGSDLQLILKEVDYIFTYFPLFQAYCYSMRTPWIISLLSWKNSLQII